MCDLRKFHGREAFGYLVDAPDIRTLVDETRRLTASIADTRTRVEALKPAFATLLAAEGGCRRSTPRRTIRAAWAAASGSTRCIARRTDR